MLKLIYKELREVVSVNIENTLSKNINAADGRASFDSACKRLLANKIILARILKECVSEYADCNVNDISEKYIEGTPQIGSVNVHTDEAPEFITGMNSEDKTIFEGTVTYDIRFRAIAPSGDGQIELIINIEAQSKFSPGYPLTKRGLYYCARLLSSQYGKEFSNSHYENLKKVYSIWICLNAPQNRQNTIMRYSVKEDSMVGYAPENVENYDLLNVIMICLGESDSENYNGLLKLLKVLLSDHIKASEKKKILSNEYDIKMTKKLESEVSDMCNIGDYYWEEAMNQGVAKGLEQGLEQAYIASIKNLMNTLHLNPEQAMDALKIPSDSRQLYLSKLNDLPS